MDIKETGKKLKPFAPVLSVALVTACVAGSLSGYEAPVYAATQEETPVKKEETKEKKEEKKTAAKGSFNLEDGVYKGTGTGYAGDITVSVLIKDKQIVSIDILSSSDDAAFFTRAKAVIDKIIEGQTLDVDTVSGATFSSRGIISAVKNALTGEKDTSETGQAQSGQTGAAAGSSTSVAQVEDAAAYKDGTYYGSGTGFGGPLKVMVEISGGKIASIQIVENSDGSDYISKAASLIDSIIATQSTNVDTVSGATYSSVGIIQAVRDALGQAAQKKISNSVSPKSVQVAVSPRKHLSGVREEQSLRLLARLEFLAIDMRIGHQLDPLYKVFGQHRMLDASHRHPVATLHRLHHRYMLLSGSIGSVLLEQRHRLSAALHHHALVQYLHYASADGTPIHFSHICFHDITAL